MDQIAQLRTNNGKLESSLEFQKKNQQLLNKQVTELEKDLKKANEASGKMTVRLESLQVRYDDLTNQLLQQQQELARFKVMNHSLEEQLNVSRSNEQRCTTELGILRETNFNTERVALTLQEVENVLKRVDAEKQGSMMSQLQSACLERDNLKSLVDNLNRQNTQLTNNLKLNLNTVTSERDKALLDCKTMQDNIAVLEMSYKQLKEAHEKLSNVSLALQSTDSDIDSCKKEIQQLKNKTAYQEKQIAELELQCEQLRKTVELKENELLNVCSLSGNMENVIREQNEYGELERQRLQNMCNQCERDLAASKAQIEELRNNVANLEFQLLEKSRAVELAESRYLDSEAQHQQNRLEFEETSRKNQEVCEQLQQVVGTLQADFENHKQETAHLSSENARLTESLTTEQSKTEELTKKLTQLNDQLNVDTTKLQNTVDMLEQEKLHLNELIADYSKRDQDNLQKTNTLYDEIQKLVQQIAFMEQMQCSMPESANSTLNTSSMSLPDDDDPHQASRLNIIIGYMRVEKQKETEMRMNAELDLQRLKAKASIDQQKIFTLESELNQVRTVADANAQAAQQNQHLVTELGMLKEIQDRFAVLKKEHTELQTKFGVIEKRAKDLAAALSQKKENTSLRERTEKVMALASKYSPEAYSALMGDFEKQKQVLNQKEQELKLVKTQLEKCTNDITTLRLQLEEKTKAMDKASSMLGQTKTLARNFRDNNNTLERQKQELEEEVKKLKTQVASLTTAAKAKAATEAAGSPSSTNTWGSNSGAAAIAGNANIKKLLENKIAVIDQLNTTNKTLQARVVELEKERQELADKLAQLQVEFDEANEKNFRLDSVQSMLTGCQSKLKKLQEELAVKEAKIQELTSRPTTPSLPASRKRNLTTAESSALPNEPESAVSVQQSLEENATKRSRLTPPIDEQELEEGNATEVAPTEAVNIDDDVMEAEALLDIEPDTVANLDDENIADAAAVEEMVFSQSEVNPAEEAFMESTTAAEPTQASSSTTQAFFNSVLEDAAKENIVAEGGFTDDDMFVEENPGSAQELELNEDELEQPQSENAAEPIVEQPEEAEEELAEEVNAAPYNLPDRFYEPLPNDPAMEVSAEHSAAQSNAEELNLELAEVEAGASKKSPYSFNPDFFIFGRPWKETAVFLHSFDHYPINWSQNNLKSTFHHNFYIILDADANNQQQEEEEEEETEQEEADNLQNPNSNKGEDEEAQEGEDSGSYEVVQQNEADEEFQEGQYGGQEEDDEDEEYDEEDDEENGREVDEDEIICLSDDDDVGASNSAAGASQPSPNGNSDTQGSEKK
uniref:Nucleoprotein TPR n=1 Tax=Ditylenchus dipsaci TaxID=166011 RepID=A0A915DZC6_9BILA